MKPEEEKKALPAVPGKPYNQALYPKETGLFDIPDIIYRRIKALNITYAKLFNRSPLHVHTAITDPSSGIVSPSYAMETGTAFHWRVLEPERFKEKVKIAPAVSKNSGRYKSWKSEQAGNVIITAADYVSVCTMARKLAKHKAAQMYLSAGYAEKAIIWYEPDFDIWCKGKIDWIRGDGQAIVDLKKTQLASKFGFLKSVYNYDYYTQAAHYMRGYEVCMGYRPKDWVWIASEIDPPNECNVFVADPMEIDVAEDKVLMWYEKFAECERTGHWPGYPDEPIYLGHRSAKMVSYKEDDIGF
jgi:hypothetical protein